MQIGQFKIETIETGFFKLDGGAMFGTIPKALWSKEIPPDELNRIPMAARVLLIRDLKNDRNLLIDTGNGHKWPDKFFKMYGLDYSETNLEKSLLEKGIKTNQITDVVLTHLHFDHAGGATSWDSQKNVVPTFESATYYVQRENYDWATKPNSREAASYLPENFLPLKDRGVLKICEGVKDFEKQIKWPGLSVYLSYGHTIGLQAPIFKVEDQCFFYPTDMIPTSHHVPLPWVMGYDIHVIKLLEEKEEVLERATKENWTLVYEHDPVVKASKVLKGEKHFASQSPVNF